TSARVCDVLPAIARAADLLTPGQDVASRVSRLVVRLDLAVPRSAVELARFSGRALDRAAYRRLIDARLTDHLPLDGAHHSPLLAKVGSAQAKLRALRVALDEWRRVRRSGLPAPELPPYRP